VKKFSERLSIDRPPFGFCGAGQLETVAKLGASDGPSAPGDNTADSCRSPNALISTIMNKPTKLEFLGVFVSLRYPFALDNRDLRGVTLAST
jgi:hypothetical protein